MISCLPIFLCDQSQDWNEPPLKAILVRILSLVAHSERDSTPLVVTDSHRIAQKAADMGFQTHVAHKGQKSENFYSRCTDCFDLAYLSGPVLFIDFRYPALDPELLNSAVQRHKLYPNVPVLSLKRTVRDHPFHLKRMPGITGTGVFHLFDRNLNKANANMSLSFVWNDARNICHSIEQEETTPLIQKKNQRARLKFPPAASPDQVGQSVGTGALLTVSKPGKHYRLKTVPAQEGSILISPFDSNGMISKHLLELKLQKGTVCFPTKLIEGKAGFLFVLIRDQGSRTFDFELPFDPGGLLWQGSTHLNTGTDITGRQNLPELFEARGPLLVVTKEQLRTLLENPKDLPVQGIAVDTVQGICIKTHLDLLRFQVVNHVLSRKQTWPPNTDQ